MSKKPGISGAISSSATDLSISPSGEAEYSFALAVERATERKVKSDTLTIARFSVKRNDIISAVCADYRSHFAAIYGKSERLPSAIHEKIVAAVDVKIASLLGQVHNNNCTTVRRAFAHKPNQMKFISRVVATGEDEITLKEQLFACHIALGQLERRYTALENSNRLTEDLRKDIQTQKMRLTLTETFIRGEIGHQEKLTAEAGTAALKQ